MRGKLARNLRRKGAIERMHKQLLAYTAMQDSGDLKDLRIKTKGIKKPLTLKEQFDLKIARVLGALENTEHNLKH